ncbi:MAG TPA: hypothetical protein VGC07_04275 [Granulicella sp.]
MATRLSPQPGLGAELDAAFEALAVFDADRLEAIEQRIRSLTAERLAEVHTSLPHIAGRHAALGELLAATEANLRVLASVLSLEPR